MLLRSWVFIGLLALAGAVLAQPAAPGIVIANPNATFPAQQRALAAADVIARGDGLYQVNCQACHGADLRGGDQGGPNLLRSDIVLNDVAGELIGEVVAAGLNRMPANPALTGDAMTALASYIHSVVASSERQGAPPPVSYDLDILVGDPTRGERFVAANCLGCHALDGDLAAIGSRYADPVDLQNSWVAGRRQGRQAPGNTGRSAVTASVQPDAGAVITGEVLRYDDFFLSLRDADGNYHSFSLVGAAAPQVTLSNPMQRHEELLGELTDDVMHDVTAYLERLK